jgi:hypothetical protein
MAFTAHLFGDIYLKNSDANPNQTNPYIPWWGDPTGLLISPLALLALVYTGKRKRSKLGVFVALLVVCGVLSLSLAGCGPSTPGDTTPGIVTPPPAEQPGQPGAAYPSTPTPGETPIETPINDCTPTPLPTLIPGGIYNPLLAIDFAKRYMTPEKMKNAGFEVWDETKCEDCTNCTNFVSYALKAGGLLMDETWYSYEIDSNPGIYNTSNAWIQTDALFNYLHNSKGFSLAGSEFVNMANFSTTFKGQNEGDQYLPLRANHDSYAQEQLINNRWSEFLENNRSAQPGDLVFYEDYRQIGWTHVGIITEDWQPPTHYNFTNVLNPDFEEPELIEHDGPNNTPLPRSIGDTISMQIYRVAILKIPSP